MSGRYEWVEVFLRAEPRDTAARGSGTGGGGFQFSVIAGSWRRQLVKLPGSGGKETCSALQLSN